MSSEAKTETRRFHTEHFLVASPYMQDSPYRHAVVLVMRHDAQGALGLVMDNQLTTNLEDSMTASRSVRRGRGDLNGGRLVDAIENEASSGGPKLRVFTGIVIWPAGKLEQEVDLGVWMTTPARLEMALRRQDLWVDLVRQIGRHVLRDALGIQTFPVDPTLN